MLTPRQELSHSIVPIPMERLIPAGAFDPQPMELEIRAHLVPHSEGLVPIDTGMEPADAAITEALIAGGATWGGLSDVLITDALPDHVGALPTIRARAPHAVIHAHAAADLPDTDPLEDGQQVRTLRVIATPGHTPGHVSLIDDDQGTLLVGDCLGVVEGTLGPLEDSWNELDRLAETRRPR